jgi:hypothetical protein
VKSNCNRPTGRLQPDRPCALHHTRGRRHRQLAMLIGQNMLAKLFFAEGL